jgi:hypothetical protein
MYELEFKVGVKELLAMLEVSEEDVVLALYGALRSGLGPEAQEICLLERKLFIECEGQIEGRTELIRVTGVRLA